MSLASFLRSCRQALSSRPLNFVVIGNESADLDSCVSSVIYAYLQASQTRDNTLIAPVLNLARKDLVLHKEFQLLLDQSKLSSGELICRDELVQGLSASATPNFILVDHNHFRVMGIEPSRVTVSGVIDHHVDEHLYQDAIPRVVQPCGSCTSLVVKHFLPLIQAGKVQDVGQVAALALSAILIDTSNLSKDATQIDFEHWWAWHILIVIVTDYLRSQLISTRDWKEQSNLESLQLAKRDVRGLSFQQLLRRDYKEWDLGPDIGLWGVSSVTASLEYLTSMSHWQDSEREHVHSQRVDVHMIMTKHGDKELLINIANPAKAEHVRRFIELAKPQLLLKPWSVQDFQGPSLFAFQQGNTSATRKKVATICQQIR